MALDYPRSSNSSPVKSTASILAIIAAIGSFYLSSKGLEFRALFAAFAGILCGLVGFLRSVSPRVSGGILSFAAILLSAIAVVVALIALIV